MFEKFTEANCSTDIECEVVRIFDMDPTKRWPPRQIYLTVGGYPIDRMPYVEEEKKRPRFLRDEIMQLTWYVVYGSIHEQKNVIIYEMLPHVMNVMKEDYGEILWIPCPMDYEEADYKRDYKEVLDCVEKVAEYKALHAAAWPDVLNMITACNIHNYSIYLRQLDDGHHYLFGYWEYTGTDFAADMAKMAADPVTQQWWALCKPMQQPLEHRAPDEWWSMMEEVFHLD